MNTKTPAANTQETIWKRVVAPDHGGLMLEAARYFLQLDFNESDHMRMARLNDKANEGTLADSEHAESEECVRVGDLISLMQAKARPSLKRCAPAT